MKIALAFQASDGNKDHWSKDKRKNNQEKQILFTISTSFQESTVQNDALFYFKHLMHWSQNVIIHDLRG